MPLTSHSDPLLIRDPNITTLGNIRALQNTNGPNITPSLDMTMIHINSLNTTLHKLEMRIVEIIERLTILENNVKSKGSNTSMEVPSAPSYADITWPKNTKFGP